VGRRLRPSIFSGGWNRKLLKKPDRLGTGTGPTKLHSRQFRLTTLCAVLVMMLSVRESEHQCERGRLLINPYPSSLKYVSYIPVCNCVRFYAIIVVLGIFYSGLFVFVSQVQFSEFRHDFISPIKRVISSVA
jgi:hypothetical protein